MTFYKSAFVFSGLLACLGLPLLSHAQNTDLGRDVNKNFNNGYSMAPANSNTVQGNPFLVARWETATLRLTPDRPPVVVPLKYDVYHQELRVRRPQGDSIIVPLTQVREFSLANAGPTRRFLCYSAALLPTETSGGCGEVLADGTQMQLLKFVQKKIVDKVIEGGGYASGTSIKVLEEQTHYYLRWPADGHFTAIRLKRAALEQALAGQPAALAALKTRKGGLSSETDLAAAVVAIDPLVTTAGK